MRRMVISLALATLCIVLSGTTEAGESASDGTYESILAELKSGHTNVDYAAFRDLYAQSKLYDPYSVPSSQNAMIAAFKANDCQKTLRAANQVLDTDFTDIQAHIIAANCARSLNDASTAAFHHDVAMGLLRSIAHSGAGTSPQSPFVVIAVKEEYAFLNSQGYRVAMQSLIHCDKGECDAMDVVDRTGTKRTFYFDVSRPMGWLATRFAQPK